MSPTSQRHTITWAMPCGRLGAWMRPFSATRCAYSSSWAGECTPLESCWWYCTLTTWLLALNIPICAIGGGRLHALQWLGSEKDMFCCRPQAAIAPNRSGAAPHPVAAAQAQAQRLSVAYNNLGGILKMQVWLMGLRFLDALQGLALAPSSPCRC